MIACAVVALLIIIVFVLASAFIGDRMGIGSNGQMLGESGSGGGQTDCSGAIKFDSAYYPWVKDAASKYLGGDEAALIALIQIESSWLPNEIVSSSGATGLGQFLASTARKGWPEFTGGKDKSGTVWPAGIIYDNPKDHSDDARLDPKRSIYAAARYLGGFMERYGSVGNAYQDGYHSYCRDLSKPSCQSQKAEAIKGRTRLEAYYNKLKSGGGCTQPAGAGTGTSNGSCLNVPYIQEGGNGSPDHYGWCGRASQAMVIAYFKPNQSPDPITSYAFQNNHQLMEGVVRDKSGKPYVGIKTRDINLAIKSVQAGNPVIVYTYGLCSAEHIFVLVGYDSATQTFRANDTFGGPKKVCLSQICRKPLTVSNLSAHLHSQTADNFFILIK